MLTLLIGSLFVAFIVYYLWSSYQQTLYWDHLGVPHLKSLPILGSLWHIGDPKRPWNLSLMENTKKFGKVWGYQEGPTNVLVISDLKAAKELLHSRFDDFQQRKLPPIFQTEPDDRDAHMADAWGARWKRLRALVSPQFSNKNLKKIYPTVGDSAEHLLRHIAKNADGAPIDIYPYFQEYSIDVICRVAMGVKESTQWKSKYAKKMIHAVSRDPRDPFFFLAAMSPFFRKYIRYLFTMMAKLFKFAGGGLMNQIEKAVTERKAERAQEGVISLEEKDSVDFIDLFLNAEADVDLKAEEGLSGKNAQIVRHMLEEEVVMQCFVFLLAGFDTTSNTLSYTSWYLAKHPECQRRLQEEIDQVCGNEKIGYDDLSELKYMDCVLKETLRLNPHATVVVGRVAGQDLEIAGVQLKKGDKVQVDSYSIQRDKEIWGTDAEEFKPDRWLNATTDQKDAYLAFGAGPRQCVGMRLAYMEQKIALAQILHKYDLVCGPKTEKRLDHYGWFTVSPVSVTVNIRKRDG